MPGLLGKKIGMTGIFTENGENVPVTVVQVGPCHVLEVKTEKKDGYNALKIGYGEKKANKVIKAEAGYSKKTGVKPSLKIKEFKNFDTENFKAGDEINTAIFTVGDKVKVSGLSIGKGFQGVMRRHGFAGVGGTTHGQSDRLRAPGSIGQSSSPSKVFKGTKMAGRTGHENVSVKNLKIVKIDNEKNVLFLKGAVPGSKNSIVEINK